MAQQVRFCTAGDGVGLAYAVHGSGPPIVRAATWLTHLDVDWESPVWRHWLAELSDGHTLVRYDERGCGLSDRELGELSVETWVADLETVVDAAGVERFTLLGVSQGAAIALVYAARHPERVSGSCSTAATRAAGTGAAARRARMPRRWSRRSAPGWTDANPAFRRVFSMLFLPEGTPEQMAWYDEQQRRSTSSEIAVRLYEARNEIDVLDVAPRVTAPTLIAHARGDRVVPVEEGRLLAARIPGARFVLLESANHILLADEPAWHAFVDELRAFLGSEPAAPEPARAEPARARGHGARRRRPDQRGDRRAADAERAHGRAPPLQRVREAARLRQGAGAPPPPCASPRDATCRPPRDARRNA